MASSLAEDLFFCVRTWHSSFFLPPTPPFPHGQCFLSQCLENGVILAKAKWHSAWWRCVFWGCFRLRVVSRLPLGRCPCKLQIGNLVLYFICRESENLFCSVRKCNDLADFDLKITMKLQQLALFLWCQYWLSNHLWSIILSFCESITCAIAAWRSTEVQNTWTDSLLPLGCWTRLHFLQHLQHLRVSRMFTIHYSCVAWLRIVPYSSFIIKHMPFFWYFQYIVLYWMHAYLFSVEN